MQRLETRISALEANVKSQPPQRFAADVVDGFREILSPLGLEVPDALPGELFADWIARISNEALEAILHYAEAERRREGSMQ